HPGYENEKRFLPVPGLADCISHSRNIAGYLCPPWLFCHDLFRFALTDPAHHPPLLPQFLYRITLHFPLVVSHPGVGYYLPPATIIYSLFPETGPDWLRVRRGRGNIPFPIHGSDPGSNTG